MIELKPEKIITTINSRMQKHAEEAVYKHIASLQKDFYSHWKGFSNAPYPKDFEKEQIDEITATCSEKERIAESASRDSFDTLRCELASKHIGKIFKGKVSHIAEFGVFVKIEKLNIEGLCHVKNLPGNDYYLYDPITKSLTTRYSKKGFYLGDSMQIKIKQVETLNQRIDLEIVK